jgi:copper chaperone CopZ
MSRRRGEFEHRTSIFEGAFRAWSHLGGLAPEDVESRPAADLDPLDYPLSGDARLTGKEVGKQNVDGSARKIYPYEPLPRSGLSHPYVQAIISPWLGPDADNEAMQLGLDTLRVWWQHRRKDESGQAIAALGTVKMKAIVERYTRDFFTLAHCIVVNENVQPPRGFHSRMKELEKQRSKQQKKQQLKQQPNNAAADADNLSNPDLTPLEKLHIAQRRMQEDSGVMVGAAPILITNLKGKCAPGKIDLPGVVDAVSRHNAVSRFVHWGVNGGPGKVTSDSSSFDHGGAPQQHHHQQQQQQQTDYGDPTTTPVVFASRNGDLQIAMTVDGITCAHCVKIVETVLRGCNGNQSPIAGLLDATADRDISSVLIKIDKTSNAKRIAFEAIRNLRLVGYTAEAKSMSILGEGSKGRADLNALSTAFEVVAQTEPQDVFDWTAPCTCPDNGVLWGDCLRHSQMNTRIFEAFTVRERRVNEYMAGCATNECRCKNCPIHGPNSVEPSLLMGAVPMMDYGANMMDTASYRDAVQTTLPQVPMHPLSPITAAAFDDEPPVQIDQPMDLSRLLVQPTTTIQQQHLQQQQEQQYQQPQQQQIYRSVGRNLSILSILSMSGGGGGIGMRGNSIGRASNSGRRYSSRNSDATFGRAMSGLSALSTIDWDNLEDFDLNVDHSAHIQN